MIVSFRFKTSALFCGQFTYSNFFTFSIQSLGGAWIVCQNKVLEADIQDFERDWVLLRGLHLLANTPLRVITIPFLKFDGQDVADTIVDLMRNF